MTSPCRRSPSPPIGRRGEGKRPPKPGRPPTRRHPTVEGSGAPRKAGLCLPPRQERVAVPTRLDSLEQPEHSVESVYTAKPSENARPAEGSASLWGCSGMIRVAVFLAALAHMPLLAWSQQPTVQPPAMQVADSYYLKRQAKLAVAAGNDSPSAVPGAQDQANAVIERTAATDTSGPRLVAAPTMGADPYHAQRQAVAVATSMRPVQSHFVSEAEQQSIPAEEVEVPQETGNSDGCGPDGCVSGQCSADGSAEPCGSEDCSGRGGLLTGRMCPPPCAASRPRTCSGTKCIRAVVCGPTSTISAGG